MRINHKKTNVSGTSLRGIVRVSYAKLVEKLGKPGRSDGYKTDAEWTLEESKTLASVSMFSRRASLVSRSPEDSVVATIYNYKDGKNYCGAQGMDVKDITEWHVGGHDERALELVKKVVGVDVEEY